MKKVAALVRDLPGVAALRELWMPRTSEGETEDEYWAFLAWLEGGKNRGAPDAANRAAAARWDWSSRAIAYEQASAISPGGEGKVAPAAEIADNLTRMLQIETKKLVQRAAKEVGETITVKDIVATLGVITEIAKETRQQQSAKIDLSGLTDDEVRQYLALQRKAKAAQRK